VIKPTKTHEALLKRELLGAPSNITGAPSNITGAPSNYVHGQNCPCLKVLKINTSTFIRKNYAHNCWMHLATPYLKPLKTKPMKLIIYIITD